MAITAAHLTTASDTSNLTAYTTASISPTAGRLVLAAVFVVGTNPTPTPVLSGCGLTWTQVDQTAVGARTVHIFRAMGTPTAGALTISLTGGTSPTGCAWTVVEFAGVDTSGTDGSGAIAQSVNAKPSSTTAPSVPFGTAVTAGNATFGCVGTAVQEDPAAGSGWTVLGTPQSFAAPTTGWMAEWAGTAQQNITATWNTAANAFVVGAEIKVAPAVVDTTAPTVPGSVTATANNPTQVTVSWAASTDAVGVASYQVKRDGTVVASAVTGTTFVDTTVAPATTYSYTVSAVDAAGNRSAESSAASATTAGAPTGTGSITRVGSNGGWGGSSPITQVLPAGTQAGDFLVVRVQTGKSGTVTTPDGWTYQDSTVDPDGGDYHYLFTRRADGSALDTPTWTSSVSGDDIGYIVTAARGVDYTNPVNAFAKATGTTLTTTAPVMSTSVANCLVLNYIGDDAAAADNIDPRYTPNDTTNWTDGLNIGLSPDSQSLHSAYRTQAAAGAVPGLTWTQHVAATTTTNGYINHQIALTPAPTAADSTPPTVPTGVTASASSPTSVTVSWTASTDGVGVSSYRVRRGGVDLSGATAVIGTSYTDTTVVGSTAYSYTVSAVDAAGNRSAESAAANVTTPSAATAPTVDAGADASTPSGTAFVRTAAENGNGASITSRAWTIVSGPAGAGTTIGTAAALSWTPTTSGTYTLRYSATNSVGTGTDDVVITVTAVVGTLVSRWVGAVTSSSITVAVKTTNTTGVRLAVSTSSSMTSPVYSASATPDANGMAKVTVSGLSAVTMYTYALELNGTLDAARGTVKTFPTAGQAADFKFGFGSCTNATDSDAFSRMKTRAPDLFIHLGDFRYLNQGTNDPAPFRSMYDEALGAVNEKTVYNSIPTAYIWSDHDFGTGTNASASSPAKPAAQSTYRQYVPHYPLPDAAGIYQTFVVGRVRFILTDLRSYRSPYTAVDDASKTVLGATQKQWFKDTITNATEKLIVWGSENPWTDTRNTEDRWGNYNTERQELANFIVASGKKVVIISGDLHALAADNGTNGAGGIPNWVAAPFQNSTSNAAGPWSEGIIADAGTNRYYGMVDVTDDGTTLTATFTGYDTTDTARLTHSVQVSDGAAPGNVDKLRIGEASPTGMYMGSSQVSAVYLGSTKVWP